MLRALLAAAASLRLAVLLLSLFTGCLVVATLLEARYGARVAQELVYRAWWFALLLALLAVNVLAAALKKYPWRRHQTGFLITHTGLLVMLAGGLLTVLLGEEGQVVLIDAADPAVQDRLGLTNRADAMVLTGAQQIEVYRLKPIRQHGDGRLLALLQRLDRGDEVPAGLNEFLDGRWTWQFTPSAFAWHADEQFTPRLPWELHWLHALASPLPGFAEDLDGKARLVVENYYPHAEDDGHGHWQPRDVPPGADLPERPALRCRLSDAGRSQPFWVGLERGAAPVRLGDDVYLVRYRPVTRPLGFALTLRRAKQIKDPGSDRPAWFESEVTVARRHGAATETADRRIYMNHPLSHGSYQLYQANYRALTDPATRRPLLADGRPVSLSGLAVARDPGLGCKYAGTVIVVLGIATMFYMRAYFFRRGGAGG